MTPRRIALAVVAIMLTAPVVTACSGSAATTTDMCAYVQGNGLDDNDASVHAVYYPGQKFEASFGEITYYLPCGPRNIRMVPGSTDVYADGTRVSSVKARTSTGNEVAVDIVMYWTLNQDRSVFTNTIIPFLAKYQAASSDSNVRNDNFSTDGWSKGFLGENAVPVFETVTRDTIRTYDDSVYEDPSKKEEVAARVSAAFMRAIKSPTGSTSNIMCGSGESSGWSGPVPSPSATPSGAADAPGASAFNCGDVRVVVSKIEPTDKSLLDIQARKAKAAAEKDANTAQLEAAKAKYGSNADTVLGDLDRIKACGEAHATCVFTQGGNPSGSVSIPVPTPTPAASKAG